MSTQDTIDKLQGLLERVQRNARASRPVASRSSLVGTEQAQASTYARPESSPPIEITELELLEEDDIIDITADDELAAPLQSSEEISEFDLDQFAEEEEEPPASSRRPKVAASMDEALAGAAELEREVPLKTPPPESGRQIASSPPGAQQPVPLPDLSGLGAADAVDELLGRPASPTLGQLGETVELDEPTSAPLELEHAAPPPSESRSSDDLEASLPGGQAAGAYDADLAPPSRARGDLAELRQREGAAEPELTSKVYQRPLAAPKSPAATFVERRPAFEPSTFLELLDASLALRTR